MEHVRQKHWPDKRCHYWDHEMMGGREEDDMITELSPTEGKYMKFDKIKIKTILM